MRRVLLHISLYFMAGIVLASFSPVPDSLLERSFLILIPLFLVLSVYLFARSRSRPLSTTFLLFLWIMAGFLYTTAYRVFHPNLLAPFYESQVSVTGSIQSDPLFFNGKRQYVLQVGQLLSAANETYRVQDRILISDSSKNGPSVVYGDQVRIAGLLLEPSAERNPGGYNDQHYLDRQGIHARLSIRASGQIQILGAKRGIYGRIITPLKEQTWNVLYRLFPPGEAELAGGLIIGFRTDLPEEWKAAFQMLGITHILAASGMNVGLLVGALFGISKRFHMAKRYATILTVGVVVFYILLSGAGPSVVRAGLMAMLFMTGMSLGRKTDTLTTIALAACLSLLWNPGTVTDLGFLLSFVTTLSLFLLTPRLIPHLPGPVWLRSALAVTLAAQVASLPLLIYYFNQLSPFSILANLYVMPLTFVLVPLGFCLILAGMIHSVLAFPFIGFYRLLLWMLVKPIVWLSEVTANWTWIVPSPPTWGVGLFYGVILLGLFAAPVSRRLQLLAQKIRVITSPFLITVFVLVSGITIGAFFLWPSTELRITYLDVGQGDSALIETPGKTRILVDGGGMPQDAQSDFDVGKKIVIPFLHHRGIRTLDYVMATHADEDHVRGLISVLQQMRVRGLIVSGYEDPGKAFQELLSLARQKEIPIYAAKAGIGWQLGPHITWQFWHPDTIHSGTRSDTNANSIVFELTYKQRVFLFTGDIEGEVEADLLPYARQVDVLKVAHHGSQYSSTVDLLEQLEPRYAIISVGRHNRYHHPHPEVLQKLARVHAIVYRTDQNGAITVRTDGERLRVIPMFP